MSNLAEKHSEPYNGYNAPFVPDDYAPAKEIDFWEDQQDDQWASIVPVGKPIDWRFAAKVYIGAFVVMLAASALSIWLHL